MTEKLFAIPHLMECHMQVQWCEVESAIQLRAALIKPLPSSYPSSTLRTGMLNELVGRTNLSYSLDVHTMGDFFRGNQGAEQTAMTSFSACQFNIGRLAQGGVNWEVVYLPLSVVAVP